MARYTDESRERVREAVDMVDLVSARSELRRGGANRYEGLCPFHEERTPSFGIDPVKKVYHCFGCGVGGDVFRFVQETEGLDFGGALELLADRYGVELEREAEDPQAAARRERRERLQGLLERTAEYYSRYLWDSGEAAEARAYLVGRGLQEETLRRFRVGYAPKPWDHMVKRWRRGGFSESELLAAGLVKRGRQNPGVYDPFRGRLMFPLADHRGRVVGLAGRALRDDHRPKYLNSPEGELFHKGRQLFAADLARAAAARTQAVLLVEGYTDVIALHQAGIENVVGMMGTALTEDQIRELGRLVGAEGRLHLALDADASGQEAMLRAAHLVTAQGRARFDVVQLPGGTDPADLLAAEGADAMRARIDGAIPLATFQIERILATADLDAIEGRNQAFEAARRVIGAMEPTPEREDLRQLVSSRLALSKDLESLLVVAPADPPGGSRTEADPRPARPARRDRREEIELTFLAQCIALPAAGGSALRDVDLDEHFTSAPARRAAAHLRDHLANPIESVSPDDHELSSLLAQLMLRATRAPASEQTLRVQLLQLDLARIERAMAVAREKQPSDLDTLAREKSERKSQLDDAVDAAMAGSAPAE
ncbi:MAG: primase [Solirubrobacteraceae bacterium]|jgi:DNA primase|nr:primase [Solirubrobacteraceae bacterium]